jgi:hypothetical protein
MENEDVVIPISSLRMSFMGNIEIPGLGEFELTEWSRRQISNILGVRWDKWFQKATAKDQADEINRRFSRADEYMKLRTSKLSSGCFGANGTLRAFVGESYSAIPDSKIASIVQMSLKNLGGELLIIRSDITCMSTSFVIGVGEPYKIGGPGEVGDVWGGILVRNSGVGFSSLKITMHLTRLICRNGMTAPIPEKELLNKRHRGIDEERIWEQLIVKFHDIPGKLNRSAVLLLEARNTQIENVEETIELVLERSRLPKRLIEPVMAAFSREEQKSAFGIVQALTFAAQKQTPEERLLLEDAASSYLQSL